MKCEGCGRAMILAGLFVAVVSPSSAMFWPENSRRTDDAQTPKQGGASQDSPPRKQRHPAYVPDREVPVNMPYDPYGYPSQMPYPMPPFQGYSYPREKCQCNCNNNPLVGGIEAPNCEWRVVFKAVAGNGRFVYDDFVSGGYINGNDPSATSITSTDQFRDHTILDNWNHLFIKRVKVEVFDEGVSKVFFVFNGIGSNIESWMSPPRLIATSFNQLKDQSSFEYFSVAGDQSADRPFFIVDTIPTCSTGCGYLMVADSTTTSKACAWEDDAPLPYFLWSDDSCGTWDSSDIQYADRFVISARICDMDW